MSSCTILRLPPPTPRPPPMFDRKLDWKTSQLCTLGAKTLSEDRVAAENNGALVSRDVICRPYGFSVLGVSFAGLAPF